MNILYCTLFNLNHSSAGLNRIYRLKESLKKYKINLIVVGSGCLSGSWEYRKKKGDKEIIFNKEAFTSIRHSKSMRFAAEASKFYKRHLKDLINNFDISGLIIYSPLGEVVGTIIRQTKQTNIFVVADCGEYYRLSVHYLLNGMIFQQAFFKYFQMKKMSGVIVPSPIWYKRASNLKIPRVLLPGLSNANVIFRNTVSSKNKPINIVFMGRLTGREMPQVIFKALTICKKQGLDFKFQLVGTKNEGYREKYWIRKLKIFIELNELTKIYGFVSDKKREKIQAEADIFIMLRPLDSESEHLFPSRIPEFMLSGNPTIISRVPSLDYYFKENCGVKFISSSNDPYELSQLIIELANNPLRRYEIGRSGRSQAIKSFSFEEMGFKLKTFLTELRQ